ncbi:AbrB/MazE/SpoVT family DNA-binding domain-containing protein [Longimicrobium sp.]|uniref:AbrB/MazE/SpoVT family DNA-binding domain-containing protein n=1 Tax=Longimicrobium sp. TaxID=2029185 RepID=UPI002C5ADF34|nr:AbrB/MazE/SpoVT family DNA-binding domain-containing protein [Longimicrobium sp.]HSU18016.1 AbrB/MazE/SpoVT family DNA-binding domain-containing protein [Longimicrobium sp.]
MPIAQVSSKSQIVLPAELRRKLGIKPGDQVRIEVRGDEIVITPLTASAFERLKALGGPVWRGAAERIERDRDEWDR